jgi:hypothetical protein
MNKNITLAVPERTLLVARRVAAEKQTTVNGLVREFFLELEKNAAPTRVSEEEEARRRKQFSEMRKRLKKQGFKPGPVVPWKREELYDRASFR